MDNYPMTKKANKQIAKRRVRRQENKLRDDAPTSDKNIGRAARRGYGLGWALK